MAEPIAALIVRILADTSEMVTGVKKATDQLDSFENRVDKLGKKLAGVFTVTAIVGFAKEIIAEVDQIDTAAKRLGASTDEFQRFSYAVKQSGGDAEGATAGVASLTARLADKDLGLLGVLRKLNISLDDFKAKDPVTRFVDLATAIASVSDPTQRLEMRMDALGVKGEKALAAVNAEFKKLADDAPVYSDASIAALKRAGDGWNDLWMRVKIGAAESTLALKDFLMMRQGVFLDDGSWVPSHAGDGSLPAPPGAPKKNIPTLGPGGVDPNNATQLALALADLAVQYGKAEEKAKDAKEQWDAGVWVLRTLKMEVTSLAGAMVPLMDAFGTSTKVDQFSQRIITAALRIAELNREQKALFEAINPGTTGLAGDDVDRQIFELRSDPRNFHQKGPEMGNLTDQALEIESALLNNFSLKLVANMMKPVGAVAAPAFGTNTPGFSSVMNPSTITVNAQGAYLGDPDSMNRLGRMIEDILAKRSTGAQTFSRR